MKLTEHIYLVGSGALGLSPLGDCHVYAVELDGEIALIDCGMFAEPAEILANLSRDGLSPTRIRYVLLTHAHPDHAGAAPYLAGRYGAAVAASPLEADVLRTGAARYYKLEGDGGFTRQWRDMPRLEADVLLAHGGELPLGGGCLKALFTPGHSAGSVCYLLDSGGTRSLFSGDTVFYKGFISLLSPPFSEYASYRDSVLSLRGLGVAGLFPSHLMWALDRGQEHIDAAAEKFLRYQLPQIKPFS